MILKRLVVLHIIDGPDYSCMISPTCKLDGAGFELLLILILVVKSGNRVDLTPLHVQIGVGAGVRRLGLARESESSIGVVLGGYSVEGAMDGLINFIVIVCGAQVYLHEVGSLNQLSVVFRGLRLDFQLGFFQIDTSLVFF